MPHLVFYEAGQAPAPRSVRELQTIAALGWEITVVHLADATAAVEELGLRSHVLPPPPGNLIAVRLSARLAELVAAREELTRRIDKLTERMAPRAGGRLSAGTLWRRARLAHNQAELARLRQERATVNARIRAIYAARRTPSPIWAGTTFGDLARLEGQWHDAARAMAALQGDVLWAADLNALPPAIWASQAARDRPPPVVFDSHELFTDLAYLPAQYRVAWRQIAEKFTPLATVAITVSESIARTLREEHGARRTLVLPNYAVPSPPAEPGLRAAIGLDERTPLAVHMGNIVADKNPAAVVDLLTGDAEMHAALVGVGAPSMIEEIRSKAAGRGVADRLHFVAPVPAAELASFVADADVSMILYPADGSRNRRFAMPHKLYDSLAAGVPVLAAEGTVAAEFLVEQRLGEAFAPTLAGSLAAAARKVMADPSIRQNARARRHEFVWTRNEAAIGELLQELLRAEDAPSAA